LCEGLALSAKIRYRQADQQCRVRTNDDHSLRVDFVEPQRAIAPGQYVVFYAGERCLGGAVIDAVLPQQLAESRTLVAAKS
jgi:tRNA-specific 2-thiouridylase